MEGIYPPEIWIRIHENEREKMVCTQAILSAENIKDMIYKNRKPLGEKLSFAKLKEEDVITIRNVFDHTKENRDRVFQNLANELKVSRATIYKVGFRKNWKHI